MLSKRKRAATSGGVKRDYFLPGRTGEVYGRWITARLFFSFLFFDGSQAPWRDSHFARVSRVLARDVSVRDGGRACTRARVRDVPPRLRRAFHRPFARVPRDLSRRKQQRPRRRQRDVPWEDEREREHPTARRDERDARAYRYYADRPVAGRFHCGGGVWLTTAAISWKREDRRHPLKWQTRRQPSSIRNDLRENRWKINETINGRIMFSVTLGFLRLRFLLALVYLSRFISRMQSGISFVISNFKRTLK